MLVVSLWTSLFGLTEPLFVPEYWSPPSLFDLALRTGFDIEALLFAFAVGGLAAVIYEAVFKTRHQPVSSSEQHEGRHKYHWFIVVSGPVLFFALAFFSGLNPIYSAFIAMFTGGFLILYCRPDLMPKMLVSAFMFGIIYFVSFLFLMFLYPSFVNQVWNIKVLSGIMVFGIPLEELVFAFGFGFLWSGIYEHVTWRKINKT